MNLLRLACCCVLLVFTLSCKRYSVESTQNCNSYIKYLLEIDTLIDKSILRGWSIECRDDSCCYVLKYDTSTPVNPLYLFGDYYYVNFYNVDTEKPIYDYILDTTMLCGLWGIDNDSCQTYIESVLKNIKKLLGDYKINKLLLYKNTNIVYHSERNGWSLFYLGDTSNHLHSKLLRLEGFRQLDSSFYWVRENKDSVYSMQQDSVFYLLRDYFDSVKRITY